jgi:hypothetical protein
VIADPSFWYNTHKLEENDVVHAKLVTAGNAKSYLANSIITNPDSPYYGWGLYGYDICTRFSPYPVGELASQGWTDVWFSRRDITIGGAVSVYYVYSPMKGKVTQAQLTFELDAIEVVGKFRLRARLGYVKYRWNDSMKYWDVTFPPNGDADFTGLIAAYCGPLIDPYKLKDLPLGRAKFILCDEAWGKICTGLSRAYLFRESWTWNKVSTIQPVRFSSNELDLRLGEIPKSAFLFNEPEQVQEHLDPWLLGRSTSNYWKNWLIQHAFLDACEHIPRMNDNSISNILELTSFIYALVVKHQIEIPKSLSSAWLAYRYQYTTSTLDAKQAISFVRRHMNIGNFEKGITCYGQSYHTVDGTDVVCRCELNVSPKEVGYLAKIWRALYTYGLQPNFYVIWDSIPYSFMVDWFVPLGDVAGAVDASRMYTSEYYTFKRIIYSLTYIRRVGESKIHCYTRWRGSSPPKLNGLYWFDPEADPSTKTRAYRALDAVSMCIGRR